MQALSIGLAASALSAASCVARTSRCFSMSAVPGLLAEATAQLAERGVELRLGSTATPGSRTSSRIAVRAGPDGAVLALCGWDGEEALASCEELRFTNGVPPYGAPNKVVASWEWRSIPSTSVARCYVAGAADAAGIVWLMGGGSTLWQGALTYDSTEFLRPYTGSVEWGYGFSDDDDDEGGSRGGGGGGGEAEWNWQKGPKMTAQRCGHGAVCDYVRGGGIYSIGGYGGGMWNKTDVFFVMFTPLLPPTLRRNNALALFISPRFPLMTYQKV